MSSRWKNDRPMSRTAFAARFPDDATCSRHLFEKRWPNGFVCPKCQAGKAWTLEAKAFTFECAGCGRQTSVTAGTIFHRSHLNLLTWFLAIYAVANHSNGISALARKIFHHHGRHGEFHTLNTRSARTLHRQRTRIRVLARKCSGRPRHRTGRRSRPRPNNYQPLRKRMDRSLLFQWCRPRLCSRAPRIPSTPRGSKRWPCRRN